jgi:hypothetical protein
MKPNEYLCTYSTEISEGNFTRNIVKEKKDNKIILSRKPDRKLSLSSEVNKDDLLHCK